MRTLWQGFLVSEEVEPATCSRNGLERWSIGFQLSGYVQIKGWVEKGGQRLEKPMLSGSWTDKVVADMPDGSHWTVFEIHPLPLGPNRYPVTLVHCAQCLLHQRTM